MAKVLQHDVNKTTNLDGKRLKDRYVWNEEKDGYVYKSNGAKVQQKELYRAVAEEVDRYQRKHESLATRLVNGNITLEQWQEQSKTLVKDSHVNMMRLGRGGKERTYGIHYLEVANDLRTVQYPALRGFAQDIKDGKLTNGQIIARSRLYGAATKTSFERGRVSQSNEKPNILRLGRRRLGACKNTCDDCIRYAMLGWQSLELVVLPGTNCKCRANCCCSIEIKEVVS
jgi:hypothetical protein